MAISTYSQLKTAIETWRERVGASAIVGNASDFITLGEAQLNSDLPLRIMWTNADLTATINSRAVTLPTDYQESEWLKITSSDRFTEIPKRTSKDMQYFATAGEPTEWAISGDHIDFNRPASTALGLQLRYRQGYALSDASPTNWLLTNRPNIYLAAVLIWSGLLLKADDLQTWMGIYNSGVDKLKMQDSKAQTAGVLLQPDPALVRNNGRMGGIYDLLWTNTGGTSGSGFDSGFG